MDYGSPCTHQHNQDPGDWELHNNIQLPHRESRYYRHPQSLAKEPNPPYPGLHEGPHGDTYRLNPRPPIHTPRSGNHHDIESSCCHASCVEHGPTKEENQVLAEVPTNHKDSSNSGPSPASTPSPRPALTSGSRQLREQGRPPGAFTNPSSASQPSIWNPISHSDFLLPPKIYDSRPLI